MDGNTCPWVGNHYTVAAHLVLSLRGRIDQIAIIEFLSYIHLQQAPGQYSTKREPIGKP